MLKISVVLVALFIALARSSVVEFNHAPKSITFPKEGELSLYDVPAVIGNLLGLSAAKPSGKWQAHGDLLSRPAAGAVFLTTEDASATGAGVYKLADKASAADGPSLGDLIDLQLANGEATLFRITETDITANNADGFDSYAKVENLSTTGSESVDVFVENAQRLINWLKSATLPHQAADLYTITVPQTAGQSEHAALQKALAELREALRLAYTDNVLIATVADAKAEQLLKSSERSPSAINLSSRQKRAASDGETMPTSTAEFYSSNYPAMFSILLFTALTLAITILFISYCMWTIEPDKDAIIYRLTMPRQAKKDL